MSYNGFGFNEFGEIVGFRFRNCRCTAVHFGVPIGTGTFIIPGPADGIIPVKVYSVRTVTVVPPVFTPHAATVRIGQAIVFIAIGIQAGQEIDFPVVHKISDYRIFPVVFKQIIHEIHHCAVRSAFPSMDQRIKTDLRLIFLNVGIIRNFDRPQCAIFDTVSNGIPSADDVRIFGVHTIQFGDNLVKCVITAHRSKFKIGNIVVAGTFFKLGLFFQGCHFLFVAIVFLPVINQYFMTIATGL